MRLIFSIHRGLHSFVKEETGDTASRIDLFAVHLSPDITTVL